MLDYRLPEELIAQHPATQRDAARLLVVDRASGSITDSTIRRLAEYFRPGDLLVLNDTKVLPARFHAARATGGQIGGLFIAEDSPGLWRVMLEGSRRLRVGETLSIASQESAARAHMTLLASDGGGVWTAHIDAAELGIPVPADAESVLARIGRAPLPPYIRRKGSTADVDAEDRKRYQTIYARRPGAVAAPTAGLHLTESLLNTIRGAGVEVAYVTLHVGLGTFKPVEVEDLAVHKMHAERYTLPAATAAAVRACRDRSGRVVAVGTTSVRVLETAAAADRCVVSRSGETDIFLYPPYSFRVVDRLVTNFHLPRSTLLALVMAFAGIDLTQAAYEHAVAARYRFYSYGDAMLIV